MQRGQEGAGGGLGALSVYLGVELAATASPCQGRTWSHSNFSSLSPPSASPYSPLLPPPLCLSPAAAIGLAGLV